MEVTKAIGRLMGAAAFSGRVDVGQAAGRCYLPTLGLGSWRRNYAANHIHS